MGDVWNTTVKIGNEEGFEMVKPGDKVTKAHLSTFEEAQQEELRRQNAIVDEEQFGPHPQDRGLAVENMGSEVFTNQGYNPPQPGDDEAKGQKNVDQEPTTSDKTAQSEAQGSGPGTDKPTSESSVSGGKVVNEGKLKTGQ